MMIPLSIFNIDLSAGNLIMFISLLMFVSILVAKIGTKFGVPTMLLFLVIGMLAGEDGLGIKIENLHVAEFLGHLAMTIILLSGGLETSLRETKPIIRKGISMTTLGLALTIVITGSFISRSSFKVQPVHRKIWIFGYTAKTEFKISKTHFRF